MSHLGNPKNGPEDKFSLRPVATRLSEILGMEVKFATDAIGEETESLANGLQEGEILLLENTRFHAGEKANDEAFAKELAKYGEIFVNDAFGTAHRKHASTYGVGAFLPTVAGFLIGKEIDMLGTTIENAEREFTAILGGAKVSSKIGVINNLLTKVDNLIIGGGMAFTFIKAMGFEIGKSLLDEENVEYSKELLAKAKEMGVNIYLPTDVVVADAFSNDAKTDIVSIENIPSDYLGLDIGPKSCETFEEVIARSKTVVWNGPMGAFEMSNFEEGTKRVALALAKCEGKTIVGGGDSASAITHFGLQDEMTHISTGGGASLEYLEGKVLPGIEVLLDK